MKHITPHEGAVSNEAQTFSPDGSSLYFTSDENREFASLIKHDLATGEKTAVVEPDWDLF